MAVPDGHDPQTRETHVNDLGDQHVVERTTRGGWRWYWVWPVVIALIFWWAGWGWGDSGGWWWGRAHSQNTAIPAPAGSRTTETLANAGARQPLTSAGAAGQNTQESGSGVQILAAQNKQPYIGKHFEVKDVPVQQKVSNRAMWLGTADNKPMLAIVNGKNNDAAADTADLGKVVDAAGTVEKAPSAAQAKRAWALPEQDAKRLEQEGAYIQVSQLTVPQQ